jgi:hypothetical protein
VSGSPSPTAGVQIAVTLQEFAVLPESTTIPEGRVTFKPEHGPEDVHELVIVRTDLPAGALPTLEDGSFDEARRGGRGHRRDRGVRSRYHDERPP